MALDLGKQMGPLPLGAWIVVVGGGLGIAWYTRRSSANDTAEPGIDTGGQPGVGDGSVGGWFPTTPPTTTPTPNPKDSVDDNDKWYTYISRELIGRFNYDPLLVDSALRKYLAGQSSKLSVSEWVIIRAALSIMTPPNPLPDDGGTPPPVPPPPGGQPPTTPKPPPKTTPKPAPKPAQRTYTVVKGDTLWGISKRFYKSGVYWPRIWNANRSKIPNPNRIYPGQVLIIP